MNKKAKKGARGARTKRLTPEMLFDVLSFATKKATDYGLTLSYLANSSESNPNLKQAFSKLSHEADEKFALAVSRQLCFLPKLAETTTSVDLLVDTVGLFIDLGEHLPALFKRCDQILGSKEAESAPESFPHRFGELMVSLVNFLEQQCTQHPERYQLLARDLPHWPALVFRHKAANNHLFEKSANGSLPIAELIKLGLDCPINVSGKANYSLQTPINAYLWEVLQDFQWGHREVAWFQTKGIHIHRQEGMEKFMVRVGGISEVEAALYARTFSLPPLTKASAKLWAEKAIMPYIKMKVADLRVIPAFSKMDTGPNGRRFAPVRKAVARALENLARPD